MSTIAQQIQAERALAGAPPVTVGVEYAEAAALALAHARARLRLPAVVPIVWVSHPGGSLGETWWHHDGSAEVVLNAGADMSPRLAAWAVLHECKHIHDGQQFCSRNYPAAEDAANAFAFDVTERQTQDFYRLSWRKPSRR
jgi:hypothetical protein